MTLERQLQVSTRQLGAGLDALEATLRGWNLPTDAVLDLRLVAEEVLTNVAKYGHGDGAEHLVDVGLKRAGDDVTLEFRDDGRPFDPLTAAPVEPAPEEGGLGLVLLRSLVDACEYRRQGVHNVLVLGKRVGQGAADVR